MNALHISYLVGKSGLGLEVMQESQSVHCNPPLLDGQYLDFVIENLDLKPTVNHKIDHFGQYFVGMSILVTDAADTDGGQLPAVMVVHFGHGDVELVSDATGYGLEHLPLTFEGHILRQAKVYPTHANIH
jgi:hypothetical protein